MQRNSNHTISDAHGNAKRRKSHYRMVTETNRSPNVVGITCALTNGNAVHFSANVRCIALTFDEFKTSKYSAISLRMPALSPSLCVRPHSVHCIAPRILHFVGATAVVGTSHQQPTTGNTKTCNKLNIYRPNRPE